jgi:hypothetical protein
MNTVQKCLFGGALIGAGLTSSAIAGTIGFDGTLFQSDSYLSYDFGYFAYSVGTTTIDTFAFSVLSDGNVVFDMLSYGIFSDFIDPMIFVFANDGNPLGYANYVAYNDDFSGMDTNGSLPGPNSRDSFLDIFLTAGEYTIAVATYLTFVSDVEGGETPSGVVFNNGGSIPDHGRYHLDIIGDVESSMAVVPLPPAAFAGLGMLAGLGAYRRMRR